MSKCRKKINVSLFYFLCIIICFVAGSYLINDALASSEIRLLQHFEPIVMLPQTSPSFDYSKNYDDVQLSHPMFLTKELATEIEALPYAVDAEISSDIWLISENLTPVFSDDSLLEQFYNQQSDDYYSKRNGADYLSFATRGISNPLPLVFNTGLYGLVEGRPFEQGDLNVIIISQELATFNELEVGSRIIIENHGREVWKQVEVEVIGIFEETGTMTSRDPNFDENRREQMVNQLYIPHTLAEAFNLSYYESEAWLIDAEALKEQGVITSLDLLLSVGANYLLRDINDLDAFRQAVINILGNEWIISDYSFNFPEAAEQFSALRLITFTVNLLAVILVLGISGYVLLKRQKVAARRTFNKSFMLKEGLLSLISASIITLVSAFIAETWPRVLLYFTIVADLKVGHSRVCVGCPPDAMRLHDLFYLDLPTQIASYQTAYNGLQIAIIVMIVSIVIFFLRKFILFSNPSTSNVQK